MTSSALAQDVGVQSLPALLDAAAEKERTTTLMLSAYSAYEDNSTSKVETSDTSFQLPRVFSDLHAGVMYVARTKKSGFSVTAGTAVRLYSATPTLTNQHGGVTFAFRRRRTQFYVSHQLNYWPYYSLPVPGSFAEAPPSAARASVEGASSRVQYALFYRPAYTQDVGAEISTRLSRRSTLTLDYRLRKTDFVREGSMRGQAIGGRFGRAVGRQASLRVGYRYEDGTPSLTAAGPPTRVHNLDLGVDYSRPLSFSRRTTIGFSSGSSIISGARSIHFRASGEAALNHQLSRSWKASVFYHRRLQLIEGFFAPLFSNELAVRSGGTIGRHVDVNIATGLALGQVGLGAPNSNYRTLTTGAHVGARLTRHIAVETQYFYYHYKFGLGVGLSSGFPRGLNRQALRAGVTFSTAPQR